MIKAYTLKNGNKRYYAKTYLGKDANTGKEDWDWKYGFKSEREARNHQARVKVDYENNKTEFKSKKLKFEDITNEWLQVYRKSVKENTYIKEEDRISSRILPHFANSYVSEITVAYCQKVANEWYKSYTKANTLVSLVNRIFKFAINQGYIESNPMDKIIRPKNTHKKEFEAKFYEKEELKHFLECIENENILVSTMFRTFAFTGLRTGELLGLQWEHIDFDKKTISVKQVLVRVKQQYKLQPPKNKNSRRTIGIDQGTLDKLALLREQNPNSIFVFSNAHGDHLNIYYCYTKLKKLIKKYKLPEISTHGLRHTHCSLLFEAGVSMNDVKDRLGHATIQTTLNIYSHVTKNKRKDTAEKFSNFMDF